MEYRTERRILNIMAKDYNISVKERRHILYSLGELRILRKDSSDLSSLNRRTYMLNRDEYAGRMIAINEFFKNKGYEEPLFLDPYDLEQSMEDYDFYYDIKTPSEYKKAEEERKAMLEALD